ncbi:MAG TPA: MBL fold metallo-hydrolase [Syntrophomonas sp.]|nr:MBL fold metallo-hydrolase [Syntrophomonas sp.]HRW12341.1 MBL fold metallo-hydrolase [Syntrophomonas sp.]
MVKEVEAMTQPDFKVVFWGVRGSIPVPGMQTVRYGGNTSCVQIQIGSRLLIMDAGTGIHKLGQALLQANQPINGDIFISHTHWDHIQGFPFFAPAFIKGNAFNLYGQTKVNLNFGDLMRGQMMYEHFPVSLEQMGATITMNELISGMTLDLEDGIQVRTLESNHPGGCLCYRVDHAGRSCCYMTDMEHSPQMDPAMIAFAAQADVLIYDANFTDDEYNGVGGLPSRVGWGHSTWQAGIKLLEAARARQLILFHHSNFHDDDDMDRIEQDARRQYAQVTAAREGMVISL